MQRELDACFQFLVALGMDGFRRPVRRVTGPVGHVAARLPDVT